MDCTALLVLIADARIAAEDLIECLLSLRFAAEDSDGPEMMKQSGTSEYLVRVIDECVNKMRAEVEEVLILDLERKDNNK